jgi:uncharacterized protein (TIGR00369 family)
MSEEERAQAGPADAGPGDPRLRDVADRVERSVFHGWAGIRLVRAAPGEVQIELDVEGHHQNLLGIVHGGMIATVADTAMGLAMRTKLAPGTTQVTGTLHVTYLRPGRAGTITGLGRVVKAGHTMGAAEADIRDDRGRLLARAEATFIVVRGRPEREGVREGI